MSADNRGHAPGDADGTGDLSPGDHLRMEIGRRGLDQVAVSKATGVSRQTINNIVNGRQAISRAMAGRLGRLTGHSSDYWLRQSFPRAASGFQDAGDAMRSLSGILVDHEIRRAVKDGIIDIDPFIAGNLQAACIDLTIDAVVTPAGGAGVNIGHNGEFTLKAGAAVNARTKERVWLPRDYLGRIGGAARLAGCGILAIHALQIPPAFNAQIPFCLFNAGQNAFPLRLFDPVISLEIVRLGAIPANPHNLDD
jgi:addiction module HigA family antidote